VWNRRDAQAWTSLTALVAGAAVNIYIVVAGVSEHPAMTSRVDPIWAAEAFVLRPVPQALLGERSVGMRPAHDLAGLAPVALGWLILAAVVFVAWRRNSRPDWPLAVLAFAYSIVVFFSVVMIAGDATGRYSVPSALLAITSMAALLRPRESSAARHGDLATRRPFGPMVPAAALLVVLALACATSFRMESLRSQGPRWSTELRSARIACGSPGVKYADVPISPYELGWHAHLPCSYLR